MSLAIGTRLGPYEIHSALGAGGMGEVYRALDTRLARTVAIKVLPEHVRSDPGLQQRFEREARAISSLNHPNICTLYDVGHSDAGGQVVEYLVLEYLEGETLASRLVRQRGAEATPLPVADALAVATQIASALDQAHRAGIVHRDLKPGNIFLVGRVVSHETRRGGRHGSAASGPLAKLLDFGLAKSASPVVGAASASMLPTTPAVDGTQAMPTLTAQGTILGTFQYMAPEQVEGLESDARTDIFAFGAVLFEMMTGRLAFEGKSRASLLGAILKDEPPPISSLNAAAPPELDRIVSTCLAKEPDDRWQTARDLLRELRWVSESPHVTATSASPEPSSGERQGRRRTGWLPWAATAALATALGVVLAGGVPWRTSPATVMRFAIVPPAAQPLLTSAEDRQIVISPDGTRIVYVAFGRQLMVREVGRLEAQPLRGTTNARHPFFSPDGRWVGFFLGTEIKKVSVLGGPPQTIARTTSVPRGASWGSNDTIVFANLDSTIGLMSVPAAGGVPKVLSRPERGELDHVFPSVLPGGRAVLFTVLPEGSIDRAQVAVLDLETGTKKVLLSGGRHAEYTETGHLVYASAGTLRAVQFDPTRLEVRGDPLLLVEGVAMAPSGAAGFTVSRNGTLAYMPGGAGGADVERSLVWVSRQGREDAVKGAPPRGYFTLRLSPDGARVALDIRDQENDIWVWDFERQTMTRLTFDSSLDVFPVWTPDGRRIVFRSARTGTNGLFWRPADGSGVDERLTSASHQQFAMSFSPDASLLVVTEAKVTSNDLSLMRMDGKGQLTPIVETMFSEGLAEISPDGRWLAYQSNESGQDQIYVRPFPDVHGGGPWQVSPGGGTKPVWSRNGRELFFLDNNGVMTATPVETSPAFSAGNGVRLFDAPYFSAVQARSYDVSRDGQRFLMIKDAPATSQNPNATPASIVVVLNWTEELKKRAANSSGD